MANSAHPSPGTACRPNLVVGTTESCPMAERRPRPAGAPWELALDGQPLPRDPDRGGSSELGYRDDSTPGVSVTVESWPCCDSGLGANLSCWRPWTPSSAAEVGKADRRISHTRAAGPAYAGAYVVCRSGQVSWTTGNRLVEPTGSLSPSQEDGRRLEGPEQEPTMRRHRRCVRFSTAVSPVPTVHTYSSSNHALAGLDRLHSSRLLQSEKVGGLFPGSADLQLGSPRRRRRRRRRGCRCRCRCLRLWRQIIAVGGAPTLDVATSRQTSDPSVGQVGPPSRIRTSL